MLSSSSSVFENLPTRPPTPPRDVSKVVDDAISFLDDSNEVERGLKRERGTVSGTDTPPPQSPTPSQELPTGSNTTKKVGFTPRPIYHQIARAGQVSSPTAQLRKRRPSQRDAKPLKSILKQSTIPPPLTPDDLETKISFFSPQEPGSFAKMLQSVIQQLAGQSTTGRLDAYLALNGALKAYEGVPDAHAMATKMRLLVQFMTRDMAWKTNGSLDTNLITQALKLTAGILYDAKLSAALDDDFRIFLIDRSITVLEQADMAKALVKAHLFLLAQQRFHSSVMTHGRADRIISSLHTIEDRCSGNSAIATRLVIYQRLLEQVPAVMLNRMRDWLEHVIHGMLSSVKEVRIRAIEICTQAGIVLGTQPQASKGLLDMFQAEVEEGQSYCDYLSLRLMQMVSDKETGAYVPQIWSAIILFFRSKRYPLEKWTKFRTWLQIIQKCLNSSDLTVRYHGHLAWDKLVFVVMPGSAISQNMFEMLKVPPTTAMDRRGGDRHSKQVRQFALDSYYNLLHYGLRPGLSHEELDSAWDVYVDPVLSGMIKANGKGRFIACGVIHGLCSASTGLWNINAANEPSAITPEELPKLEPKWVRSRLAKFLKLMEPMLFSTMWGSPQSTAAVDAAWHSLMQSVADAGSQEVKTSNELKEAIALLVNILRSLWNGSNQQPVDTDPNVFYERYTSVISTIARCLGPGPLAEDILTKTKEDAIQAALTPSHRSSKHHSVPRSPFVLLFGLLYTPNEMPSQLEGHSNLASTLLQLLLASRHSPLAQIDLLNRSLKIWSGSYASEAHSSVVACLWRCVADLAAGVLQSPHPSANSHESQILGLEFRNACEILAHGVTYVSADRGCLRASQTLYNAIFSAAKAASGAAGTVLAVVEPFAKALSEANASVSEEAKLRLTKNILGTAIWPHSRHELDVARKAIWGVGLAPHKAVVFDPYDHLYQLVTEVAMRTYNKVDSLEAEGLDDALQYFASVVSFLQTCPLSMLAVALRKLQYGFVTWLEDPDRKTRSSAMSGVVQSLWQELLRLLRSLPQTDTTLLKALESLLTAGFSSPQRAIVNATIDFWNSTFGSQETLEYPQKLETVLRARLAETELILPDFPSGDDNASSIALPAFFDTQIDASLHQQRPRTAPNGSVSDVSRVPSTAPVVRSAHFLSRAGANTERPTSSPATSATKRPLHDTPRLRLRHDDSQVLFAPIDSSPARYDDSQMLTERQKEVKVKQQDNAQMFPDLSSSPIVKPNSSARSIQKRLDFTSDNISADGSEGAGTPMALPDAEGLMSDDIPSSPTPSTKDAESAQIEMDEDLDTDVDEPQDPPSSPPQQKDDDGVAGAQGTGSRDRQTPTEADANLGAGSDDAEQLDELCQADAGIEDDYEHFETARAYYQHSSDLPSDTPLPTEQLLKEEEAATEAEIKVAAGEETEGTTLFDPTANAELPRPNIAQQSAFEKNAPESATSGEKAVDGEVTRVENSFVEIKAAGQVEDAADPTADSQHSQRTSRKRKRPSSTVYSSKKRKQQSPFKRATDRATRFFAGFLGRSQEEENDDDIEEEIVVASSQLASSPVRTRPSPTVEVPPRSAETVTIEPASAEVPQKRGRGRPRKSETPTPASSQVQPASGRSLKRRASALSDVSPAETEPATSFVKDTPAPSKARKVRQGPDAQLVEAAQLSQDGTELGRATRRTATAVAPPEKSASGPKKALDTGDGGTRADGTVGVEQEGSEKRLAAEEVAAFNDRPIATPRSILGRLRNVLADLPKMILGSQEEREMDDVLFQIRREVHEAGRRGRE